MGYSSHVYTSSTLTTTPFSCILGSATKKMVVRLELKEDIEEKGSGGGEVAGIGGTDGGRPAVGHWREEEACKVLERGRELLGERVRGKLKIEVFLERFSE